MDKREYRLLQIASVAESEAIGGLLFYTHVGVMLFGGLTVFLLYGIGLIPALVSVYALFFTIEKHVAGRAHRAGDVAKYPLVLGLLLVRAVTYNVLIYVVWTNDGDVFKLTTLALLIAATINIMVFHATYWALMVCVVVPLWLGFSTLAFQVGWDGNWSTETIGAICSLFGISPYFLLALHNAHRRWMQQQETKVALKQSQRIDGMGKIAGGVSHDFNNILSVVSGSLQLLADEQDEAERTRLLGVANRAIDSGARLSKQLMAFGKRSPLLPRATDLHETLAEFKAFAENVLPETIRLEIVPANTRPFVFVDVQMLHTALLNLAVNAKLAMPAGGQITVRYGIARAQDARNAGLSGATRYATIAVSDTGVGMDDQTLNRVFEPFYTTREVGGGSGLGLPMVKGFAEQSSGSVSLVSAVGKGTTVTLFLPLFDMRAPAVITHRPEIAPPPAGCPDARILVVEDNIPLLKIIELRLRKDGLKVVACENGDQAVQVLEDLTDFDLVLSDFVMPGQIQGPDLLYRVRLAKQHIPFILMSGYADTDKFGLEHAINQADLVIEKPFSLERLSHQIAGMIATSKLPTIRPPDA